MEDSDLQTGLVIKEEYIEDQVFNRGGSSSRTVRPGVHFYLIF